MEMLYIVLMFEEFQPVLKFKEILWSFDLWTFY